MVACVEQVEILATMQGAGGNVSVPITIFALSDGELPSDCSPGSFVLLTPFEYESVSVNPYSVDVTGATQISIAIAGVWAIAWVFRQLIKLMALEKESE